jgi:hypothetical protein
MYLIQVKCEIMNQDKFIARNYTVKALNVEVN